MRKKLSLLDERTGETINLPIYLNSPQRRPTIYGSRWLQMAQDPLLALTQDTELRGLTTTVLLYLCGRLDFDNYVKVSQQEIADHINASRQAVNQAVNLLLKKAGFNQGPLRWALQFLSLEPGIRLEGRQQESP